MVALVESRWDRAEIAEGVDAGTRPKFVPKAPEAGEGGPDPDPPRRSWTGVIVVVGLLLVLVGAVAVPNWIHARQRGRQMRTMADMRAVATSVEAYAVDHQKYPATQSMARLRALVEPTYIRELPQVDGWGNPFEYSSDGASYLLRSRGSDGAWSGEVGKTVDFAADVVFENGSYTTWPEGIMQ